MNKKGFEFSFAWLFAIIVGMVIIFLAVYATTNIIGTKRIESDSKVAAQLGIILNPIETNLESGKYVQIGFPDETRLLNNCENSGNFGRQSISTSVRSGIGKEWQRPGEPNIFFNKYLFSKRTEQGKTLHIFVKPLEMPFKIADLIFVSVDNYCFVNPPTEIEEEIQDLNPGNIQIGASLAECESDRVKVCFSVSGCDINVNVQAKTVEKNGEVVKYEDALIYGAIFADAGIYECQVKRLMKRSSELSHLYVGKTEFLSSRGCSSNLASDLVSFATLASQLDSSANLGSVFLASKELRRRNELLSCKLF